MPKSVMFETMEGSKQQNAELREFLRETLLAAISSREPWTNR